MVNSFSSFRQSITNVMSMEEIKKLKKVSSRSKSVSKKTASVTSFKSSL